MIKVLVNAYACSPEMGSEPGMAWNWCTNLANYCELYIITEGEFKDKIEKALPLLPQGSNMHFYYNTVSERVRRLCWNQGDWRFYIHYARWQKKTLKIAEEIISKYPIDIVHQLNMIGFREPGDLWKIDKPYIWGPVGANTSFPRSFLSGMPFDLKMFFVLKNFLTHLQCKYGYRINQAAHRASCLISAFSEASAFIKKNIGVESVVLNETGCVVSDVSRSSSFCKDGITILWVGKMDILKQLRIAIQVTSLLFKNGVPVHLQIVGGGNPRRYRLEANKLGIMTICQWYGAVSHERVQEMMRSADLLLFTSVREGTPHTVIEAISNCLPVVCFDCCGQGDAVNEKIGIKIPLTDPDQSVVDFVNAITDLYRHPDRLKAMSDNCKLRQKELSWEEKAKTMLAYYQSVLDKA